jgi:hypothetical protein
MITRILRLWRGQIELGQAFWEYAIVYGSLANLIATITAFAVIAAGGPPLVAVIAFLLPVPYNFAAAVGVWRSADRYRGPAERAQLARIAVAVWAVIASVA